MIKEIRVDDRLIHGQIALTWPKALNVKRILVANDEASMDKTQQMTLKMAVSDNIKVLVKSIDDSIKLFEHPKAKDVDIMVIVNKVADAEKLAEKLEDIIVRVNVANMGRFDGIPNNQKTTLITNVLLSDSEKQALERLVDKYSFEIVHQIVPDNSVRKIKDLL